MSTHQMIVMLLRMVRCGRLRLAAAGTAATPATAGTATEYGFAINDFTHCAVLSEGDCVIDKRSSREQVGHATH
jgi:hypothetical protein